MILQLKHTFYLHVLKSKNKSASFSFLIFHKLNRYGNLTFNKTVLFWK